AAADVAPMLPVRGPIANRLVGEGRQAVLPRHARVPWLLAGRHATADRWTGLLPPGEHLVPDRGAPRPRPGSGSAGLPGTRSCGPATRPLAGQAGRRGGGAWSPSPPAAALLQRA